MGEQINAFEMNSHVQLKIMNTLLKNGNTFFQVSTSNKSTVFWLLLQHVLTDLIFCFLFADLVIMGNNTYDKIFLYTLDCKLTLPMYRNCDQFHRKRESKILQNKISCQKHCNPQVLFKWDCRRGELSEVQGLKSPQHIAPGWHQ